MDWNKANKRKVITLEAMLDAIKRFDNGENKENKGRILEFGDSTLMAILNKTTEYRKEGKMTSVSFSMQCTINGSPLKNEMEYFTKNNV